MKPEQIIIPVANTEVMHDINNRRLSAGYRFKELSERHNAVLSAFTLHQGTLVTRAALGEAIGFPEDTDYGDRRTMSRLSSQVSIIRTALNDMKFGLGEAKHGAIRVAHIRQQPGWVMLTHWSKD